VRYNFAATDSYRSLPPETVGRIDGFFSRRRARGAFRNDRILNRSGEWVVQGRSLRSWSPLRTITPWITRRSRQVYSQSAYNCKSIKRNGSGLNKSGDRRSEVQQTAKRPNIWAYLIRGNIFLIAPLPIEEQCFNHFLAIRIAYGL
jgi:hypothetical protein